MRGSAAARLRRGCGACAMRARVGPACAVQRGGEGAARVRRGCGACGLGSVRAGPTCAVQKAKNSRGLTLTLTLTRTLT